MIWGQWRSDHGGRHRTGWAPQWRVFQGQRAVNLSVWSQIYDSALHGSKAVFLAPRGHAGPPQTDGCWQWLAAIWVAVNWRDSWAHFMPRWFVWNVRDLELSMCGQRSPGVGNSGSFESKIRNVGRCECVWGDAAPTCVFITVGVVISASVWTVLINYRCSMCALIDVWICSWQSVCAVGRPAVQGQTLL